jgi:hypothetical protein
MRRGRKTLLAQAVALIGYCYNPKLGFDLAVHKGPQAFAPRQNMYTGYHFAQKGRRHAGQTEYLPAWRSNQILVD